MSDLAQLLAGEGYAGLFLAGDRSREPEAWAGGEQRAALRDLVADEAADDLVRLLASEVLFRNDPDYPPDDLRAGLPEVYAAGLATAGDTSHPLRLDGELWGFMYPSEERSIPDDGPLGARLVAFGEASVPPLTELLDHEGRIYYQGSQEATLGNRYRYRVKDAAAYFIGRITGIPVAFHDDPPQRDAEIARLRAALDERR